jgi:hypothetical protein
MLTHGAPLKGVSEIRGHSSKAITGDVYGHVAREAVATLGAVLGKKGGLTMVIGAHTTPESDQGRSGSLRNGPDLALWG